MRMTILGCGTSGGVPRIGGHWGDCDPEQPRNRRRRASVMVEAGDSRLIVDTSPDFREQCLSAGVDRVDAILYSHGHADHVHGIDDLRGITLNTRERVPVYGDDVTLAELKSRFAYIFDSQQGYPAIADPHEIDGAFAIGDIPVTPFRQQHGVLGSLGFRFGPVAYSTDLVALDDAAFAVLEGVDTWVVDALRPKPHPTHAHLDLTLGWIKRLRPRRAILTHMTWEMDYDTLCRELPDGVTPAYDGMVIELPA